MYSHTPLCRFWAPSITPYRMLLPPQQTTSIARADYDVVTGVVFAAAVVVTVNVVTAQRRSCACWRHPHWAPLCVELENSITIGGDVHNCSTKTTTNKNNTILCVRGSEMPPSCKGEEAKKKLAELSFSCSNIYQTAPLLF